MTSEVHFIQSRHYVNWKVATVQLEILFFISYCQFLVGAENLYNKLNKDGECEKIGITLEKGISLAKGMKPIRGRRSVYRPANSSKK